MALETEEAVTMVADMKMSRGDKEEPVQENLLLLKAENFELFSETGETIRFGDLYKNQKTIIILVRNFLCFMAKEYVDDLALIPEQNLKDANVRLVVIGCAPHKFIRNFKYETGYKLEMYCDPERQVYKALGCYSVYKRGHTKPSKHVKSGNIMGVLTAAWRGMWFRQYQGDINQQGGSFILGPGDTVSHFHRDLAPHDHTPINQLLQIVDAEQVSFQKDAPVIKI